MNKCEKLKAARLKHDRFPKLLAISFIFASVTSYSLYSLSLAMDLPMGDHWRWIRGLLVHFVNGRIGLFEYITGEFYPFSHSHIITLFFVWINYLFFDLNYKIEFYIGLISHMVMIFLLSKYYLKNICNPIEKKYALLILILFFCILLNPRNVVAWSLVQFEYFYLMTAVVFLISFASFLRKRFPVWGVAILVPLFFFIGDAMGISAILAVVTYIILFELTDKYNALLMIVTIIAICYGLAHLIIPDMHPHTQLTKMETLIFLIDNPLIVFNFLLRVCSQTLAEPTAFKILFGKYSDIMLYLSGLLILIFMLMAIGFYSFYRNRIFPTVLPMLFILFAMATTIGIMFSRLPEFGPSIAHANRYTRLFQLGFVGALWINAGVLFHFISELPLYDKFMKNFGIAVATTILIGLLSHSAFLWKDHGSIVEGRQNALQALKQYANDFDFDIGGVERRCSDHFCKPSIIFLRDNKLSFFNEQ